MRFRRVIVILWLGLILMTTGAVIVGRAQPIPEGLAMLHLDMCAPPCWIGITPSVTTLEDAATQINKVFPSSLYRVSGSSEIYTVQDISDPDFAFSVQFDSDKSVIKRFELTFQQLWLSNTWGPFGKGFVTFGELNDLWGSPKQFAITCTFNLLPRYDIASGSYIVVTPNEYVEAGSDISWNSVVTAVLMPFNSSAAGNAEWQRWRGFLTYQQYGYDNVFALCQP